MLSYRERWRALVHRALIAEGARGGELPPQQVVIEIPPRPELGDLAFPMFSYARLLRRPPQQIAVQVAGRIAAEGQGPGSAEAEGPYLNVRLDRGAVVREVLQATGDRERPYGANDSMAGRKIMVEFSCPNTNKPLHLGHLRNDALGMSVSRLLQACGAEVMRVNLINDRGIHICKSMLAYQRFGEGATPEKRGQKSDHLVGDFYVRFAEWAREDPSAEAEARRLLKAWEDGDPEVKALWELMNRWAIEGIEETYRRTGVSFDKVYLESQTYLLGREEVLAGLRRRTFQKDQDGSVWVDLTDAGLDRKVLLRSDGTSLYVTQDIGTAVQRHRDWPFQQMVYVVGSEQRYHFQVLFKTLEVLGYSWAANLHHLAYGMVNLPEGKMKSREGTVVDADDLLDELERLAEAEIRERGREEAMENPAGTASNIALGALGYYLLQPSPYKDMVFDPRESISFTGNTGPYLQYTGARLCSMLEKFEARRERFAGGQVRPELLQRDEEWQIFSQLAAFPETVLLAARELNPSILAGHLFETARSFSRYYHDNPVLHNEDPDLVVSRIALARAVRDVLETGMRLIEVPFLQKM